MTMTTDALVESGEEIRLLLVDDHAIVRQGLRSVLQREEGILIVGEAEDPAQAKTLVAELAPHMVCLDLKLSTSSDGEGIALCEELTTLHPDIAVLVLTTFLDERLVLRAIRAGARGYVVKDVDTSALVRAIRDVSRGGSAFDARSAAAVVKGLHGSEDEQPKELTARELEVLRLLASGLSNSRIGQELFISDTTAKFHVGNILRKLGVSRRAEAVYAASKAGLL